MSDASNGQENARAGLGIDWARPTVWMRLLLASVLTGLTIGAVPPVTGLIIADWFHLAGKTLQVTTLLVSVVIVLGLATAILQLLLKKIAATRFILQSQATFPQLVAAFVWSLVIAILAAQTGKMILRLADPGYFEAGSPVAVFGSALACIFFLTNSDLIVIWLRRAGSAATTS